ncbi:SgcJ/EcaC family oxidoreductase [Fulvivirga ulvae]|uniref:SgcJ/EcaC family oxidoreductase n=1 Tax=Fulvivirga ulvae TaxID=2904245 RepID=UPI001F15D6C8|nr:SgcJ/EcaC family oxidoreductase [Fulvivirga ulvae]UII31466.1 SgcJ/EcaC family oxidoreductase [Fulvivirga ulvae]
MKQYKPSEINNTLTVYPNDASQEMITRLLNKVKELEQTQQAEDVSGFMALFDENAVWVNGAGTRLIGKEAIKKFTQQVLPGAFADGSSATYHVEHIVVLAPGIVLTAVCKPTSIVRELQHQKDRLHTFGSIQMTNG